MPEKIEKQLQNNVQNNDKKSNVEYDMSTEKLKMLDEVLSTHMDIKPAFAKVYFGQGCGPYILAFENSADFDCCECTAKEFKSISPKDIKSNKYIPIWEFGSKSLEDVGKLKKLDVQKYIETKNFTKSIKRG